MTSFPNEELARQIKDLAVHAGLIPAPAKALAADGADHPDDREPN
jgi:hypothetical protein